VSIIEIHDLVKTFKVRAAGNGRRGIAAVLRPERQVREAVSGLSMRVEEGEIVGLLGPNGAGKSTTMKCLCGVLLPTSGTVRVDGLDPFRERSTLTRRLGVVFGQKTTLWWDVPVIDTYRLLRRIYDIPRREYEETVEDLTDVLGLHDILQSPVRQLSLGQRVRADLGAAFLHRPRVLFLDEPTIGLDISAKSKLRDFVRRSRERTGVTVLLTTHDLRDIELLSDRIIIIDRGRAVFAGSIAETISRLSPYTTVVLELMDAVAAEDVTDEVSAALPGTDVVVPDDCTMRVTFQRDLLPVTRVIDHLTRRYRVRDFRLEEPQIENIVRELYETGFHESARHTPR
jgi:ABC-2 type transport system ATP-binding protein